MSIILMMLLGLICMQESLQANWPEPPSWLDAWLGPSGSLVATVSCLGIAWLIGSVYTEIFCRALERNPDQIRRLRRRFQTMQKSHLILLTVVFLTALYYLGWGHFVRSLWDDQRNSLPGKELALLGPFIIALVGCWVRFYDVEKTIHDLETASRDAMVGAVTPPADAGGSLSDTGSSLASVSRKASWWRFPIEQFLTLGLAPRRKTGMAAENTGQTPVPEVQPTRPPFLSRGAYVGLQARFNLLLIMPPLVLMLLQQVVLWLVPWRQDKEFLQYFLGGFLIVALLILPWMLRLFLGLRPMPAGPLRDRLEKTIRRLRFRCSDILLWNTRQSSANAMVTGLLPWPRYIVLTDQLLRDLSADEVDAVLGHEIGHVKHHHMLFFMLFLFGSLTALGALYQVCNTILGETVQPLLADHAPWADGWLQSVKSFQAFPATLALGLYLFVVFGYLSRCCETQADIYGSRTVSPEVFISALEKVAVLNYIPREKPGWFSSWRHPTIARRVDFLRRMSEDPNLEPRFQRRIGRFKWSVLLTLILLLACLWRSGGFAEPNEQNPGGMPNTNISR